MVKESFIDLRDLETELKLRSYTPATIIAYLRHNREFLKFCNKKQSEVGVQDIRSYLATLLSDKKQKSTSVNLTLSALKFYYKDLLKRDLFIDIKPPKTDKKLPTVLTRDEVKKLLELEGNPKHKLLLQLLYATGMRVSEAVKVRVQDLNLSERMGRVVSGKGRKDRNIILSETLIASIKGYMAEKKISEGYLFPSKSSCLSVRMAQKIVKDAAKKAQIPQRVFCHALRSSFATHLLESGIDIRLIQELLGHADLSTTQRYTKVSTEQLKRIKSPLDML